MNHIIRFYRDTSTGEHIAVCSCHWSMRGELSDLQARAATHDLNALPDIPAVVPYASGLEET